MPSAKKYSGTFFRLGYMIFACGLLSLIADFIARTIFSYPFNLGIVLGSGAIALTGVVTITLAHFVKVVENRLDKLEKIQQ